MRISAAIAFAALLAAFDAGAQITFSPTPYAVGNTPHVIRIADVNGDGRPDIVVLILAPGAALGSVSVLLASGPPGSFAPAVNYPLPEHQPTGLAVADLNGDGFPDLAVATPSSGIRVLLNDGSGGFPTSTSVFAGDASDVIASNLDGGATDLAIAGRTSGTVPTLHGNGDGTFTAGLTLPGAGTMGTLVTGDFNGDGNMDIAALDTNNSFLHTYVGAGDGTFTVGPTYQTGLIPTAIAAADVNGDGKLDLAVTNSNATVSIFLGNGDGTFQLPISVGTGTGPETIQIADIDYDGIPDLVLGSSGVDRVTIHTGNGDGTFAAPIGIVAGTGVFAVAVADLDGDGRLDVVSTTNTGDITVLLNTTSVRPSAPTGVTASAQDGQVTVSFGLPTQAIAGLLDFTSTCNGISVTSVSTSIVVTGLINGTPYTCTVTARNTVGVGPAGGPSNSVVPLFATTTALGTSATPVLAGISVTLTATVTGSTPTGTVNFMDGGTTIAGCGTVAIAAGTAQCMTAFTSGGTHAITADYSGDASHATSTGTLAGGQAVTAPQTSFTGTTATATGSATISFTGGGTSCGFAPQGTGALQSAFFIPVTGSPKSPPSAPPGVAFPQGLVDFVLVNCTAGSTVAFTITYPTALAAGAQYWKYGPTSGTPSPHWYVLPATITGNVVTFSITDGGLGDDDLTANGTVVDQGGPGGGGGGGGGAGGIGIPTLSEWMLALLAALLFTVAALSRSSSCRESERRPASASR